MEHALPQLKELQGFGDMLEDDVEKCHQDMIRFMSRYGKSKNETMKAVAYSRHERIVNDPNVEEKRRSYKRGNEREEDEGGAQCKAGAKSL